MSPDDTPVHDARTTRRSVLAAAGVLGAGAFLPVAAKAADADRFLSDDDAMTDPETVGEQTNATVQASGPDWPQDGAGPGHASFLPDGVAPTTNPTERWRYRNDRYHDGVAVVGDAVYVGGKSLAAVDLDSGVERWSYDPAPPPAYQPPEGETPEFGPPAVDGGTVYACLGWGVWDGGTPTDVLAAVDAASGEQQWWFDPDGFTSYATPVVADGTVYTTGHRESDGQRVVFALADDGSVAWQRPVGAGSRDAVAVADGTVYAVGDSGVVALDAATGDERWSALPNVALTVPPVVGPGGRLFVGEANEPGVTVIALDAATGDEHWRTAYTPEHETLSIEAADGDRVYIQMMYSDAGVVALDAATGEEAWRTTLEYEPPPEYYIDGVGRVGDYLYAGSVCLDPANGDVVWRHGLSVTGSGWWLGAAARGVSVVIGTEVVVLEDPGDGGSGGSGGSGTTTDQQATDQPTTDQDSADGGSTTTEDSSSGSDASTDTPTTTPELGSGECEI